MTYRVIWIQAAFDELASLWMNADSAAKIAINQSVVAIDGQLQKDPFAKSESRDPNEWVMFSTPLGVLMEIDAAKKIVWVLSVWRYR